MRDARDNFAAQKLGPSHLLTKRTAAAVRVVNDHDEDDRGERGESRGSRVFRRVSQRLFATMTKMYSGLLWLPLFTGA